MPILSTIVLRKNGINKLEKLLIENNKLKSVSRMFISLCISLYKGAALLPQNALEKELNFN